MTEEKKVSGKLTDEQLALTVDQLENRVSVQRGSSPKKPRQPMKEAAARLFQKAIGGNNTVKKVQPAPQQAPDTASTLTQAVATTQQAPTATQAVAMTQQAPTATQAAAPQQKPAPKPAPQQKPAPKPAPQQRPAQPQQPPRAKTGQGAPMQGKKPMGMPLGGVQNDQPNGQAKKPTTMRQDQGVKKLENPQNAKKPEQSIMKKPNGRPNARKQPVGATIELSEPIQIRPDTSQNNSGAKGKKRGEKEQRKTPVRIIPLGGLHEVGKNVTVYECQNDMFLVDCGMTFPDDQMLGVDLVLPDFTYVYKNRERLRGIVITHGHEDHIGSLPYFLKEVNVPVYATKLTLGLIENKLREHGLYGKVKLVQIAPRETIRLGCMGVEFIRVNHSIPDAVALAIHTPAGIIVQTGDFKIDYTPIMGDIIDLPRFGELGSKGVLALLSDSTNAERPGFTPTECTVRESFDKLFQQAREKRIIIATFSSNIYRMQLIVEAAVKYGRKVAVSGRSMLNAVDVAVALGYLNAPKNILIDIDEINRYPQEKIAIITTGSQGEPMSALSRMASGDHRKVAVTPNDAIIISATPIPGNEKTVSRVINDLMKLGAEVIHERMYEVHVSGHACQEELKIMLAMTRPKFFFPVHGEYKQLKRHAGLALAMGMDDNHVIMGANGQVFELDGVSVKTGEVVQSGRVLVDGLGVGDVGSVVLRDRKHLGEDGLIIVVIAIKRETGEILAGPDVVSRGFVYVREAEDMLTEARGVARKAIDDCVRNNIREWGNMKNQVRDSLSSYFYGRTKRSPMILPVIQEI